MYKPFNLLPVAAMLIFPMAVGFFHPPAQPTSNGETALMATVVKAEVLYEMDLKMTGMTEFGSSFNAIMNGETPPPAEGARFDVTFEGTIKGPKLNGTVSGVDYLSIRADGRSDLNIYLTITTDDGQKIAAQMGGNAVGRAGSTIIDIRENGTMFTSAENYKWVNALQVWSVGTVDRSNGTIKLTASAN